MSIAPDPGKRIPPSTLPLRLQLAREWRGFTQDELASALDVSRATISNYERGVGVKGISRLQVNAWAAFCDVDVEWLKTGIEPANDAPDGGGNATSDPDLSPLSDSNRGPSLYIVDASLAA